MDVVAILQKVSAGAMTVGEAEQLLKYMPFDDIGYALVDHHRQLRNGYPEVIYCAGKTAAQIKGITENMLERGAKNILATRANRNDFEAVAEAAPNAVYHETSRLVTVENEPFPKKSGNILVVTGGTSDMPVSEEAAVTANFLGNNVTRLNDVGVAGLHRLLSRLDAVEEADVIIAVAGMEGALASVVGGLTDKPVVAVPTSVGYGANFGGLSALLAMLNSCASGVGVVNIDNGFGAACLANNILKLKQ